VEIQDEQNFRWLGRADSVINSGGVKIFPEKVERKLQTLIDIPFFISAIDDKILGQKLVFVAECNATELRKIELLLQKPLPDISKYEMPKAHYSLEKFVYSSSNKVLRKETLNEALKADKR
jgi:O-succinylbenzoic acid--CoA ligase